MRHNPIAYLVSKDQLYITDVKTESIVERFFDRGENGFRFEASGDGLGRVAGDVESESLGCEINGAVVVLQ